jgi:hypothetical protein
MQRFHFTVSAPQLTAGLTAANHQFNANLSTVRHLRRCVFFSDGLFVCAVVGIVVGIDSL